MESFPIFMFRRRKGRGVPLERYWLGVHPSHFLEGITKTGFRSEILYETQFLLWKCRKILKEIFAAEIRVAIRNGGGVIPVSFAKILVKWYGLTFACFASVSA